MEEIHQIDLPFEIEGMIFKKDSNFSLITSAITQPDIQLYPSFSIKGDIWRYQRGNALVEVIDGKENIHKCLEDECQRAWLINFVSVHDEIRPILGVKDKYIYEGEQFSFFGKRLNVAFLKENSKTVLFYRNKEYIFDDVKKIGITKLGISLVKDESTDVLTWDGSKKTLDVRGIIANLEKNELIYQDLQNKVIFNERIIGLCNENFDLISKGQGWILGSCDGVARYYFQGVWKDLGKIDPLKSDGSDSFIALAYPRKSIILDRTLSPVFSLKESITGLDRKKAVLLANNKVIVIDLVNTQEVLVSHDSEGKLLIRYPLGYSLTKGDLLVTLNKEINSAIHERIEYLGSNDSEGITLSSDFIEAPISFKTNSPPINIDFTGKLFLAENNGKVKEGDGNSILIGKLRLSRRVDSEIRLRISLGSVTKIIKLDKDGNIKIPMEIRWIKSKIVELKLELLFKDIVISSVSCIIPIVKVKKPLNMRKIVVNKGNIIAEIKRYENELFFWDDIGIHPTYNQKILIKSYNQGESSKTGNINIKIVEQSNPFIEINIKDSMIQMPKIWIEGNYLHIIPILNVDTIIQIYYSTYVYTGFKAHVFFPLDPAYNTIIMKIILGNLVIEKRFIINSVTLSLMTAVRSALTLQELTETAGVP
ncbi:protein UpsX [Metallosphaera hakonensis]|uniref:protein UpsX n=1 Tax=Metallosphaera hakonensis TaxID=79601 RepID=UPI0011B1EF41|nr:hypothetical protein [Metallosphaera hakonensis]AWR99634.2 hypothetical protein DFR87_07970 [Metallosphaera hakonensis JCM 8857 = DSM 7519]